MADAPAADGMSGISAILASILYQTLNYAITVFFVSRSRRLLDAVLIGFGWLLALFLLQQSFLSFFNDRSQFFIQADAYNITNMQLQTALSFVSLLSLGGMYFRGNTGPAHDGVMAVVDPACHRGVLLVEALVRAAEV